MKILILNGSPRKNGNVAKLLNEIAENFDSDCKWELIHVNELNFDFCKGCMACRSKGNCILPEDDAHKIAKKIMEADALVVGSPCYWGNINGKMKMLFDRLVYVMMGENKVGLPLPKQKGKKCAIVATSTTPFPFNILAKQTGGVVRELKEILRYSGYKCAGVLQKGGTHLKKEISQSELKKAKKIGKKLSKLSR